MSKITSRDLAASLLKKFSPSKLTSEDNSLNPADVEDLAAMMKSPNRMKSPTMMKSPLMKSPNKLKSPRHDTEDIEDVEGAEYESYKAKGGLSTEGLGGQLTIGGALRQIENKSPIKGQPTIKGNKAKLNNAKDKKKANGGDMLIEEKENDNDNKDAMEEEEVKPKDAKKKEVKKKGKASVEKKDGAMEEEEEKPKDEEEKPATKTVKNFKKKNVQVEDAEETKETKDKKEKEKEKPTAKGKGLNAKRKAKESDDEGEGDGEEKDEKDEEVEAKKKQTKKMKKEDGNEKIVPKKDEKVKSAEKKGKKDEASAEKEKPKKEKKTNKKKNDDEEEKEKEKTEEKPEEKPEEKEDEGESAKKKKVGGLKSKEGSGTKKVTFEKDSGKKENKEEEKEKEKEKEKEEKKENKKIGKFVKLTIDEEKLKDSVLKNKKGTTPNAASKAKKDTKDVKKGKEDKDAGKKDKKKAEGKKKEKGDKKEKKDKEGKDGKKKTSGKKGKKKGDEEEDEMEIEDDEEEENMKESDLSQLYDDDEDDEEEEEENEFGLDDDEEGGQKKKVLRESGPEVDTYWKKNLRDNATPEKKKVSGGKSSPFDITSSLKKTSKKVMNCSGLTQDDTDFLYASIKKLGGFDIQNLQDPALTHLIYTGEKRTIKVLYALAKRAWILDPGYIYSSYEFGDWIAEKDFECSSFPSKKTRDETGPLFKDMKFFFKSVNYLTLSLDELQNLVKLSGGKIVENKEDADIIVENGKEKHDPMEEISSSQGPTVINHKWVLDSLTNYTKLDFADFPANE